MLDALFIHTRLNLDSFLAFLLSVKKTGFHSGSLPDLNDVVEGGRTFILEVSFVF